MRALFLRAGLYSGLAGSGEDIRPASSYTAAHPRTSVAALVNFPKISGLRIGQAKSLILNPGLKKMARLNLQ
ncbi:hypothetical protein J6590_092503 [Homalodisca vitripennis]|nr:hypothetical protein J6590_092503 [Homalodisca vitripennis]